MRKESHLWVQLLATYGWVILVVILVTSALFYFGIFNPNRFIPRTVDCGPGIHIVDSQVSEDAVSLVVKNGQFEKISDLQLNVTLCNQNRGSLSRPISLSPGEVGAVVVYCPDIEEHGTLLRSDIDVSFVLTAKGNKIEQFQQGKLCQDVIQKQTFTWNKTIDGGNVDLSKAAAIDSKGNIYIAGEGEHLVSNSSGRDWWIKKYSSNGVEDITWNLTFDAGLENDFISAIAIDSTDHVYVAGVGNDLVTPISRSDWWIKKFTSDGVEDLTWNKSFDGGKDDYANALAIDSTDNIYVAGSGMQLVSSSSGEDMWIKKFDVNGSEDMTWNKKLNGGANDAVYALVIDSNDHLYVGGSGEHLISDSSSGDMWILKYDSDGRVNDEYWDKAFDGRYHDRINSMAVDSDDNLYIAGQGKSLVSDSSDYDWWIKKFSSEGVEYSSNWNKVFDNGGASDVPHDIGVDKLNNVYVVGDLGSGFHIKKFTSDGTEDRVNWNKLWTESSVAHAVVIDQSNNVYVAGYGRYSTSTDWWVKRFESDGREII